MPPYDCIKVDDATIDPSEFVVRSADGTPDSANCVVVAFVVVEFPVTTKFPLIVDDAVERSPARVVSAEKELVLVNVFAVYDFGIVVEPWMYVFTRSSV